MGKHDGCQGISRQHLGRKAKGSTPVTSSTLTQSKYPGGPDCRITHEATTPANTEPDMEHLLEAKHEQHLIIPDTPDYSTFPTEILLLM